MIGSPLVPRVGQCQYPQKQHSTLAEWDGRRDRDGTSLVWAISRAEAAGPGACASDLRWLTLSTVVHAHLKADEEPEIRVLS
jgi:hypothetical protein